MTLLLAPIEGTPYVGGNAPGFQSVSATGLQVLVKNNLTATSDPTSSDDSNAGYRVGSRWINTITGKVFEAVSVATLAAVWQDLTATTPPAGSGTELQIRGSATAFGALTGSSSANGGIALASQAIGSVPLSVTLASGQTADAMQVTSYGGTAGDKFKVDANGRMSLYGIETNSGTGYSYPYLSQGMYSVHLSLASNVCINWGSASALSTADTGLARNTAGAVAVNNGTAGQYGGLVAKVYTAKSGTANNYDGRFEVATTGVAAAAGALCGVAGSGSFMSFISNGYLHATSSAVVQNDGSYPTWVWSMDGRSAYEGVKLTRYAAGAGSSTIPLSIASTGATTLNAASDNPLTVQANSVTAMTVDSAGDLNVTKSGAAIRFSANGHRLSDIGGAGFAVYNSGTLMGGWFSNQLIHSSTLTLGSPYGSGYSNAVSITSLGTDILGLSKDVRCRYDASNYLSTTVSLVGGATIEPFGTTPGIQFGNSASKRLGFWAATPIVQPSAADQVALINNTAGTYDGTLEALPDPTDSPASADALRDDLVSVLLPALRNNFTDLYTQVAAVRTALVNAGLMKGAA